MEESILAGFRWVHIASGFVALFVAPIAMAVRKGGDAHRLWGKVFFYGMVLVALTAIIMGIWQNKMFLAMMAVLSFHMAASGYRALYHKRLHAGQKPGTSDLVLQGTAGVVNGGLFIWGFVNILLGNKGVGTMLFIAFGLIGSFMVWRNLQRFYKHHHEKHEWLFAHMAGFLGGYIATVSAFSAVNMAFIKPVWLQWLWPTIVGVPLIILWSRYYRKRLSRGRRARDVVEIRIQ
ncbi:MAG TPA: DUF2306 domain-containing protein [Flavobacteriales bacterium]|nr:DUF2306 domain-containing protein [Flavobacteriales bacterium]